MKIEDTKNFEKNGDNNKIFKVMNNDKSSNYNICIKLRKITKSELNIQINHEKITLDSRYNSNSPTNFYHGNSQNKAIFSFITITTTIFDSSKTKKKEFFQPP